MIRMKTATGSTTLSWLILVYKYSNTNGMATFSRLDISDVISIETEKDEKP